MKKLSREINYWRTYLRNRRNYSCANNRKVSLLTAIRWYWPWRNSLRAGRSPIADRVPWIVFGAKEHLSQYVGPDKSVFEYGMGGSTLFFLDAGCIVISVEHHAEWGAKLSDLIGSNTRWTGLVVPPRQKTENTENDRYGSHFPSYENSDFQEYVETIAAQPDESLDIVMVDGRARSAALAAAASKVVPSGLIVLDNSERRRYADAVNDLCSEGWSANRLYGPGPYVDYECWDTLFLVKPSLRKS
jgi:hypothetical protein